MTGNSAPVQLTDRAAKRIVEIMRDESGGASMLRVAVTGGGCSGFQYDFSVEQNRADDPLYRRALAELQKIAKRT